MANKMEKLNRWFWWFLSHVLLIHVIGPADNRRIGINFILDSSGKAVVFVIPAFPWLSVYHRFETNCFYFGWRAYTFQFRVRRNYQGKWYFSKRSLFVGIGQQSLLMSWEEWEDLSSQHPNSKLNMDRYRIWNKNMGSG
jgi:hypothetical protein